MLKSYGRFFVCCALSLFGVTFTNNVLAATSDDTVVIEFKDGTSVEYELQSKPVVTFLASALDVSTDVASAEYDLGKVAGFHFSKTSTGIRDVLNGQQVKISYLTNYQVVLCGASGLRCSLYNAGGYLVSEKQVDTNDFTLSLTGLPDGIYLLKLSNGCSLKFLKK